MNDKLIAKYNLCPFQNDIMMEAMNVEDVVIAEKSDISSSLLYSVFDEKYDIPVYIVGHSEVIFYIILF